MLIAIVFLKYKILNIGTNFMVSGAKILSKFELTKQVACFKVHFITYKRLKLLSTETYCFLIYYYANLIVLAVLVSQ